MNIVKGELFDSKDDILLVTTNSYLRKDGALLMGRGAALQLAIKYPKLRYIFGKMIKYYSKHLGEYNVLLATEMGGELSVKFPIYGIFQVKYHFSDPADLGLIGRSVGFLIKLQRNNTVYKNKKVSMNFPGIGFGQLKYEDVLPIVTMLPDNVTLYLKETE
jgi:hypothetical protein